jgi:hypothetical protein
MKYKTLLLGTAAVFALAGSARAADLAVAESVEYVKVCDAYGVGYFYIPGSDTCLKISGDIEVGVHYDSLKGWDGTTTDKTGEDDLSWAFRTEANATLTAKSMTDWGMLTGFINMRNRRTAGAVTGFYAETAYLTIGGFTAGWLASQFDGEVPAGLIGGDNYMHDQHQNQFSWSTKAGPWGFTLSVEDPNDNGAGISGSQAFAPTPNDSDILPGIPGAVANTWTGGWPDIVAAVTGGSGPFSWKAAFGVTDTTIGTGYGGKLNATWAQGANSLGFQVSASNAAGSLYGANIQPGAFGTGTYWEAAVGGSWGITSAMTAFLLAGYDAAPGQNAWELQGEVDWTVGKGAKIGAFVGYASKDLTNDINKARTQAELRFQRTFD